MTSQITISLKKDELEQIEWFMHHFAMKRHEVVKLAIRRFLFPDEKNHRLNGITATIEDIPNMPCHKSITITRSDGTERSPKDLPKLDEKDIQGFRDAGMVETDFVLSGITKTSKPSVTEGEE